MILKKRNTDHKIKQEVCFVNMQLMEKSERKWLLLKRKRSEKRKKKPNWIQNHTEYRETNDTSLKATNFQARRSLSLIYILYRRLHLCINKGVTRCRYISNGLETGLHQQFVAWHAWSIHTCFSYSRLKSVKLTLEG